jgi:hypothetical protein
MPPSAVPAAGAKAAKLVAVPKTRRKPAEH